MVCCSLTINLDDYRRLSLHNKKPAEAVCVDWCVTHLLAHPHFGNGTLRYFSIPANRSTSTSNAHGTATSLMTRRGRST